MNRTDISNTDNIIDSRDVIARIEELEAEREALAEWDASNEARELASLKTLADEASGYAADWQYGEVLVRDSYFKDYAMELAEELTRASCACSWPNTCIDWDQAARELRMDYTSVDFDGVRYWIR